MKIIEKIVELLIFVDSFGLSEKIRSENEKKNSVGKNRIRFSVYIESKMSPIDSSSVDAERNSRFSRFSFEIFKKKPRRQFSTTFKPSSVANSPHKRWTRKTKFRSIVFFVRIFLSCFSTNEFYRYFLSVKQLLESFQFVFCGNTKFL